MLAGDLHCLQSSTATMVEALLGVGLGFRVSECQNVIIRQLCSKFSSQKPDLAMFVADAAAP